MSHDNKGVLPTNFLSVTNSGGLDPQIKSPLHVKLAIQLLIIIQMLIKLKRF